jgi:4'-phosphopantetheinyl transferase
MVRERENSAMISVDVWWARSTWSNGSLELLDEVERGRHARYLRAEDKARFLTARVLAKTVLAGRLGVRPNEITFDSTCSCGQPHGKPKLPAGGAELSISHSGDWITVAVTSSAAVGVDVEQVPAKPVDDAMLDATLSTQELAVLRGLSDAERSEAFVTYWTRKEALLKATAEGLSTPMPSITLTSPSEAPRVLHPGKSIVDPTNCALVDLAPRAGYRACVAVIGADGATVVEHDAQAMLAAQPTSP